VSFPPHWPPLIGDMWQDTTTDEQWMCAGSAQQVNGFVQLAVGMVCAQGSRCAAIDDWYERTEGHVVLVYRDGVKP
jgi:hypothetical protein